MVDSGLGTFLQHDRGADSENADNGDGSESGIEREREYMERDEEAPHNKRGRLPAPHRTRFNEDGKKA